MNFCFKQVLPWSNYCHITWFSFIPVPPIIRSLTNVTAAEGESATLVCLSDGDPEPTMAFRKIGGTGEYRMGENVSY
jgi:hypothetical protein